MSSGTPARYELTAFVRERANEFATGATLDLGCKNSPYIDLLPSRVGVDISPGLGVSVLGNARELPFSDESFQTVLCTEMLEHVPEPASVVEELRRVLAPTGYCILTTRFCYPIHGSPDDYYRFTEHGLRYLFREWDLRYLQADTDALATAAIVIDSGFAERAKDSWLSHAASQFLWRPVRKTIFSLYPHFRGRRSSSVPAGYHLIAQKRARL